MIIYKRSLNKKLFSLRLTFFILAVVCFLAFNYQYANLGYFIAVTLIALSMIVIKDFIVSIESVSISKYYFFGLIKWTWRFNKGDNIKVSSFGADFGQDGEMPDLNTIPDLGCLLSIFAIFLPSQIIMKEFKVEKIDAFKKPSKRVYILLDKTEFNYLKALSPHQPSSS